MFTFYSVNWWAVIVAAVVQMIIGFIWFSPALFGKAWMRENNVNPDDQEMVQQIRKAQGKIFPVMFLMTLVSSYILAVVFKNLNVLKVGAGVGVAFWLWLGFMFPYIVGSVLVARKKAVAIWMELGHTILGMLISGAILAAWK